MSSPSRRAVLRRGAVLGAAGVSGCLGVFGEGGPFRSGNSGYQCETGRTRYEAEAAITAEATWPMRQYDAGHTSANPDATVPDEVATRWRYTACREIYGFATVADQCVYPGRLAIDAQTGSPKTGKWTRHQKPAVVDGTLYVGSYDLHAYDATDLTHQWTFEAAGKPHGVSAPVVRDGTVYIAGNIDDPSLYATLYAVDIADGSERWQFTPANEFDTPPAVVDGYVYAVDEQGVLYNLDAATGAEQWRTQIETEYVDGVPTVSNGTVLLAVEDGAVVAIDAADGHHHWRSETVNSSCSVAVADETVFVAGAEQCLALAMADGTKRWRADTVTGEVCSVAANTVVFGGSKTVTALSRADGTQLWSFETRAVDFSDYVSWGFSSAPALVEDTIVVATIASDIYALGAASEMTDSQTTAT